MPFHVVAWAKSQDEASAYLSQDGIPDETVTVTGTIVYVPAFASQLIGAYQAMGSTGLAGYLQSPTLRATALFDIYPVELALKPTGSEAVIMQPDSPIKLTAGEGLEAFGSSTTVAAAEHSTVAFLADGPIAPVTGEIFSILFSTAITETIKAWKNGPITFRQTLPVGNYSVVGAMMSGTNGIAFRFVPKGAINRPGAICVGTVAYKGNPVFRNGGLGKWFDFNTATPPSVDWFASATAGAAQTGVMDLMKA